ncbi:MAG: sensor histidine kinase [Alphaproteobacteria bacterium]|nr:sensor histidine kinase [Alphaproteobacteria bacterium]
MSASKPAEVARAANADLSARAVAAVRECGLASEKCPVIALKDALAREAVLLRERDDHIQQMRLLSDESEHRLLNSLQIVSGLLAMQGRCTTCAEAAGQLSAASARVAAMGRVHRRLHSMDAQHGVAFKPYLEGICEDISAMLSGQGDAEAVQVDACEITLPTETAVPLGFIVAELITNAVKYGAGDVAVRLAREGNNMCRLSVSNSGRCLPDTFAPAASKGLGMKIVLSFVRQIGGELNFGCVEADQGVRVSVLFPVVQ